MSGSNNSTLRKDPKYVFAKPFLAGMRRPRILYMITRAEHGGAQTHLLSLLDGFRDQYEVEVAVGDEGFLTRACREKGIPIHVIRSLQREINPVADSRALVETIRLIRQLRPDLIHAHTSKAGMIGRLAARLCGVQSVYTVHMWPFGNEVPVSWRLFGPIVERVSARWTQRLITVSRKGAETGRQYRIAEQSKIIPVQNGIPDCPGRANFANRVPIIAMVARFSPFKDHETLVRAFAQIESLARLMLIGDGQTRSAVENLVSQLGIGDRVDFMGDRADVPELLANADVFVLASKFEHLPISILEAMRAGLPVIASDVGGIQEAVIHAETGFAVPPRSVPALAGVLSSLIGDAGLRARMGRAGRVRFETLFEARHMIELTGRVYLDVLSEARIACSQPVAAGGNDISIRNLY